MNTEFDALKEIETDEEIVDYLKEGLAEGGHDTVYMAMVLGNIMRAILIRKPGAQPVENIPRRNGIPFQKILDLYHEILPMLPRCVKLSEARRSQIRGRWNDGLDSIEEWEAFFKKVAVSPFLTGQVEGFGDRPAFRADLVWITKEANFLKILEGKYHGKTKRI